MGGNAIINMVAVEMCEVWRSL